jgi:DNA-binding beta-propeller fold protein YncE
MIPQKLTSKRYIAPVILVSSFFIIFGFFSRGTDGIDAFSDSGNDTSIGTNTSNFRFSEIEFSNFANKSGADNLDILKSVHFKDGTPASVISDPLTDMIYVAVNPTNSTSSFCLDRESTISSNLTSSLSCSTIYVLDGRSDKVAGVIRLSQGEQISSMDLDPIGGTLYAVGEYNYFPISNSSSEELYEDDVLYKISNSSDHTPTIPKINSSSEFVTYNISKISLYGETEEGKEGDARAVKADSTSNTIFVGLVYFEGGKQGIFMIPENFTNNSFELIQRNGVASHHGEDGTAYDNISRSQEDYVIYLPFAGSGPDRIVLDERTQLVYASDREGNLIAVINGSDSNGELLDKIILKSPRALSINALNNFLYVASGEGHWFNIIDTKTNKVIAANTEISYPIASAANSMTGKVYVADCLLCDEFEFTNGTSIYELDNNGTTVDLKTFEDIDMNGNELTINHSTNELYMIGTDMRSGLPNLYIINISSS